MSATIYEVARAAGVSTATVSRALNGSAQVADRTKHRITEAIAALGYQPNHVARSLVLKATHTIAVMLPDITNPFFPALVKGVQLAADEEGYAVLLAHTGGDPAKEESYFQVLRGQQVDGVLLVGLVSAPESLKGLVGRGLPVVMLDRPVDLPGSATVRVDHKAGGRIATEHLLELGHHHIAHIAGPKELGVSQQRLDGYRRALSSHGVAFEESLVAEGDFSEDGGYRGIQDLLRARTRFTALFAANDLSAIGAMTALREHGLQVPGDVSVVGFDDIHLASYTSPKLTTVRQPIYDMGRAAAKLLIDARRKKVSLKDKIFDGELVVRESTVEAPKSRSRSK
jgi:DNA-binding LacI/PurR family transcriptional regulator